MPMRFAARPGTCHAGAGACRFAGLFILIVLAASAQENSSCWLRDAASPAPSVAQVLCQQGLLWTTTDGGATWSQQKMGATETMRALAFLDVKRGYAVGNQGTLLATEDGGKTWKPTDAGTKEHLMDIAFIGEAGWIAGYQGVILHSTDGGKTWAKQKSGTTQTLENVYFLDQDHGWSVGWAGTILRTTDGGKNWQAVRADLAQWSLTGVYFKDPQNGWLVGFAGQILRSKDGGVHWEIQTSPVKNWLTNIAFDSSNRGWITYDDGFLLSQDGGETWKQVNVPGRFFLAKLQLVDKSLWAIGQSAILRQTGNGLEWKKIDSLIPSSATREMMGTSTAAAPASPPATNQP